MMTSCAKAVHANCDGIRPCAEKGASGVLFTLPFISASRIILGIVCAAMSLIIAMFALDDVIKLYGTRTIVRPPLLRSLLIHSDFVCFGVFVAVGLFIVFHDYRDRINEEKARLNNKDDHAAIKKSNSMEKSGPRVSAKVPSSASTHRSPAFPPSTPDSISRTWVTAQLPSLVCTVLPCACALLALLIPALAKPFPHVNVAEAAFSLLEVPLMLRNLLALHSGWALGVFMAVGALILRKDYHDRMHEERQRLRNVASLENEPCGTAITLEVDRSDALVAVPVMACVCVCAMVALLVWVLAAGPVAYLSVVQSAVLEAPWMVYLLLKVFIHLEVFLGAFIAVGIYILYHDYHDRSSEEKEILHGKIPVLGNEDIDEAETSVLPDSNAEDIEEDETSESVLPHSDQNQPVGNATDRKEECKNVTLFTALPSPSMIIACGCAVAALLLTVLGPEPPTYQGVNISAAPLLEMVMMLRSIFVSHMEVGLCFFIAMGIPVLFHDYHDHFNEEKTRVSSESALIPNDSGNEEVVNTEKSGLPGSDQMACYAAELGTSTKRITLAGACALLALLVQALGAEVPNVAEAALLFLEGLVMLRNLLALHSGLALAAFIAVGFFILCRDYHDRIDEEQEQEQEHVRDEVVSVTQPANGSSPVNTQITLSFQFPAVAFLIFACACAIMVLVVPNLTAEPTTYLRVAQSALEVPVMLRKVFQRNLEVALGAFITMGLAILCHDYRDRLEEQNGKEASTSSNKGSFDGVSNLPGARDIGLALLLGYLLVAGESMVNNTFRPMFCSVWKALAESGRTLLVLFHLLLLVVFGSLATLDAFTGRVLRAKEKPE